MITWEHCKKTYIDVEKYLIDSRPERTNDMLGVRDYKYLKQELRWLIKERHLKICEISRILLHMIEIFSRNQFSCTYSTPEYHQKFENIENRLAKIAQLLFTYQKLIVIYQPNEILENGLEEFNKIWKNMTLQELFLIVLEKKSETSLFEFVNVFKPEILNNYYTLFYEVRRQLRDMPMKTMFMKLDFLLPLSASKLEEINNQPDDPLIDVNINRPEIGLWGLWEKDNQQALFCKLYAKNCCSAYNEQYEVENRIIPLFLKNREKNAKKYIFSTVDGIEHLAQIKDTLQSGETYLKLVKQFTQLYGEADFSLQCIEAAIKNKGFAENEDLKKEYINLSLYSILIYENNLIDIDYFEFKSQKTLKKICLIISQNPTNPGIILSSKTMKLFSEYSQKPNKFLKILKKFIHLPECTPHIFHEAFKCIQKEFDNESKNSIFQNLFSFICQKLSFEHHDYLEEYVDILTDKTQKEKIQLYSNMSRIVYNFGINKNVGYFEQFINFDSNKKDKKSKKEATSNEIDDKNMNNNQNPSEGTSNQDIIERGDKLIEEIIEKYVYNTISEKNKQIALDRTMKIIDIRKISHMKTLLNYLQDHLLYKVLSKGEVEKKLFRKLLECEKFLQFRDMMNQTSLSIEDVDRIILLNIRNTFKKYQINQIKRTVVEHFNLLRLDNPTRVQEQAFYDLACMISDPPISMDIPLQQLRKKEKFELLRQILKFYCQPQKIQDLIKIDFFTLHKYFTLYDKPDEEYVPFKEEQYLNFLKDYALNLVQVEKIVEIIEILKEEKSQYVSDLCYYLITAFDNLSSSQKKRFTQLGLLECNDVNLMMKIVSVIHQNKVNQLPLKELQTQNSQSQLEQPLINRSSLLGKENPSLSELKDGDDDQTQENITSQDKLQLAQEHPKQQQSKWGLFNKMTNVFQGLIEGTQKQIQKQLQSKGSDIRILNDQVLSPEAKQLQKSNEGELKRLLYKFYNYLTQFVSQKKVTSHMTDKENNEEESEQGQNQIENRKKQIELFCKLLTRNPSQAFYILALNKQYFDLQLISEIIMMLLKNNFVQFDTNYLISYMVKICIFRLGEAPKGNIFKQNLTKQQVQDTFIPYVEQKYQKTDANRRVFERFFDSFILMKQISYFTEFITKGILNSILNLKQIFKYFSLFLIIISINQIMVCLSVLNQMFILRISLIHLQAEKQHYQFNFQKLIETEHKFLFEKAYRNTIIGQMIQESGNIEIFEKEPDIFRMEDFNTKELLISSIVCELKNNDMEKCLRLWKKIAVLTKSELNNSNKSQQQVDQSWLECFKSIYERCKNLKALIELLDRIHEENKEIFNKFVERKSFQLLKSLNNVQCDVDMSKYVRFDQLFRSKDFQNINSNQSHNLIKFKHNSDKQATNNEVYLDAQNGNQKNSDKLNQSLTQINKSEIRQDLEEYNVFVLAHVLGHFIENADSLVYYIFAKKVLRKKVKKGPDHEEDEIENDSNDEMYDLKQKKKNNQNGDQSLQRREIVEIMIDRINSIEFLKSQIQKICKKSETDPQKLKKYRLLVHLLIEKEQKLIDSSLTYNKYTTSSQQNQLASNKKHMNESLYLRMTCNIETSQGGETLSDKACIWRYFETLLTQESTNLLDCSECKYLVTEFIQSKFSNIIYVYESASVEFRANFGDIVYERVENNISNYCQQAPLRKQLLQLLERIQLNMENVDSLIFDAIVSLVLQQNSNDSINIVLISTKEALSLTLEQNKVLLQLSAVLRMSFMLQDSSIINTIKLALTQNIQNIDYFIEKYLKEIISKVNQVSQISDIIKLKYLAQYLKNTSLYKELVRTCAENLSPNVLIPLLSQKYLSFKDIESIENTLNLAFILSYNSFISQKAQIIPLNEIIETLLQYEEDIDPDLFQGFILQYIGAAAFKGVPKYKDLFEALLKLIDDKPQFEQTLNSSQLKEFETEMQFSNYLTELKQCYQICTYKSLDDLIVYNMIYMANESKYYDSAKLNYRYQNYPKDQSSVSFFLQKLKEDIQPMQNNQNLSDITLKKLKLAIPEILKKY